MRDELDELLDRYAPEAGELWLSALPDPAPEHEFSPKFRRKVEKLLRRQRRSPAVNAALRYGRRAAAFALVFLTLWEANARYPFCYSCCLLLFGAALLAAPRSEEQGTFQ